MTAKSMDQFHAAVSVDFGTQGGDIDLDYIGELLPVIIVKMLQEFGLGQGLVHMIGEIFQEPIFQGRKQNRMASPLD